MTKHFPSIRCVLIVSASFLFYTQTALPAPTPEPELSFDIWDWTAPAQNPDVFRVWIEDLAGLGFTRIELSVPWRVLEPDPGRYDLRWLEERLETCEEADLGIRLRINSYYGGATPDWYAGDRWLDAQGNSVPQGPPSIMDERFWDHYGPLCEKNRRAGQGPEYPL
ncbi:MAG: hypothetical protein BWY09_03122 [Candidatus Hydrogenedentes bacterium ADurb.Bin179]|nr:MAG: hypothetical protein BWY09_03122 [Candidatus Hydrogenedentes bacterium ADurb.Bin179]